MSSNKYCVIMAGGVGARFWPKSRQSKPKQFLDILGTGKSFLRHTFERFVEMIPVENFVVVTNKRYRSLVLEHLPELKEEQILCEPIGRNTAPAIAYASFWLASKDPSAEMVVTPADHFISDEAGMRSIISECLDFARENNALMTVGVRPTRPETGYGYIQVTDANPISRVKCFTEKPDLELAQKFLQMGEFFWNSGIFVWQVEDILKALQEHLPELYSLFDAEKESYATENEEDAMMGVFAECRSISIDYGVMEKADNVYVRTGEFGWSDVGTWGSVHQHSRKDKYANVSPDNVFLYDTRNSFISLPEGKVAVVSGLKEYIVVDTDDVLMICPRSEEQNIKKFIDEVKYHKGDDVI